MQCKPLSAGHFGSLGFEDFGFQVDRIFGLFAVLLWLELRGYPLAGINPKPGARYSLTIKPIAGVIFIVRCHPIVSAIVGNIEDFIGVNIGAIFFCERVLLTKLRVFIERDSGMSGSSPIERSDSPWATRKSISPASSSL
jgi:hypothetical protein